MTVNDERESLSAALHEAAHTFEPPDGEALYQGALRRGRRLRRRRTAGTALTGTAALGVAAALAFGLAGVGADAPKPTPAPAATKPVPVQDLPKYMATTFMSLLPAGTALELGGGIVPLTGDGYGMNSNLGDWQADAQAFVTYQGERYTLQFSVVHQRLNTDCENGFNLAACSEQTFDGGQYVTLTMGNGTNDPYSYSAAMNYAGGKAVILQVNPNLNIKNPHQPFTTAQLQRILTSTAWKPVLAALPALVNCPSMTQAPGKLATTEWICTATGKLYPAMGDPYLYPTK
jgi:hypothetical protein